MTISKRDQRTLIIGGSLLAGILLLYFVVIPLNADWRDARQRIDSSRNELEQLTNDARLDQRRRQQLLEFFGPAALRALPSLDDARSNFVNDVDDIMREAGMNVASINPGSTSEVGEVQGLVEFPLRLNVSGGINNFAQSLAAMADADRLILVDQVNVAPQGGGRGDEVDVSLTLITLAWEQTSD